MGVKDDEGRGGGITHTCSSWGFVRTPLFPGKSVGYSAPFSYHTSSSLRSSGTLQWSSRSLRTPPPWSPQGGDALGSSRTPSSPTPSRTRCGNSTSSTLLSGFASPDPPAHPWWLWWSLGSGAAPMPPGSICHWGHWLLFWVPKLGILLTLARWDPNRD